MNEALLLLLLLLLATYWSTLATTQITRNTCSSTNRLHAYDRTIAVLKKFTSSEGKPTRNGGDSFQHGKSKKVGNKDIFSLNASVNGAPKVFLIKFTLADTRYLINTFQASPARDGELHIHGVLLLVTRQWLFYGSSNEREAFDGQEMNAEYF